jgi:hypothetical protein
VDCLVSPLPPPSGTTIGTVLLAMRSGQLLLDAGVDALPTPAVLHPGDGGRPCGYLRARFAGDDGAAAGGGAAAVPPESSGTGDGTVRAARRGGGREHVAALRPQTVSDGGLTGRWVPVEDTLLLPALRWWRPLIAHLAGSSAP